VTFEHKDSGIATVRPVLIVDVHHGRRLVRRLLMVPSARN
jgi:hypothetical protein